MYILFRTWFSAVDDNTRYRKLRRARSGKDGSPLTAEQIVHLREQQLAKGPIPVTDLWLSIIAEQLAELRDFAAVFEAQFCESAELEPEPAPAPAATPAVDPEPPVQWRPRGRYLVTHRRRSNDEQEQYFPDFESAQAFLERRDADHVLFDLEYGKDEPFTYVFDRQQGRAVPVPA